MSKGMNTFYFLQNSKHSTILAACVTIHMMLTMWKKEKEKNKIKIK